MHEGDDLSVKLEALKKQKVGGVLHSPISLDNV